MKQAQVKWRPMKNSFPCRSKEGKKGECGLSGKNSCGFQKEVAKGNNFGTKKEVAWTHQFPFIF